MKNKNSILTALILATAGAHAAPPANDHFAASDFIPGNGGTATVSTVEATSESGEPMHYAGTSATAGRSVWFAWSAPADGTAVVDTAGSNFDTVLAGYTPLDGGPAAIESLLPCLFSDDATGLGSQSRVTLPAVGGMTYYFAVDGYSAGISGTVKFNLAFTPGAVPANHPFANAVPLAGPAGQLIGTSLGATVDGGDPDTTHGASVWYTWTAPSPGQAAIRVRRLNGEPRAVVAVFTGGSPAALVPVAPEDEAVSFQAVTGTAYRIRVSGGQFSFSAGGDFVVSYGLDTGRGVVEFRQSQRALSEDSAQVTFEVIRSGSAAGSASVRYRFPAVSGLGIATNGTDFTGQDGTLYFAPGQASTSLVVPITDDASFEADEAFTVTLSDPSPGLSLGANESGTITILDDDAFVPTAGRFIGRNLASDPNALDFTLTSGGLVTGKFRFQGITFLIRGYVNADGVLTTVLPRKGQPPLELVAQFLSDTQARTSVRDSAGEVTNGFAARVPTFTKAAPFPGTGTFTAVANETTGAGAPRGTGYFTARVSQLGAVKVAGKLADGTPFAAACVVSPHSSSGQEFNVFTPLYGGKGRLFFTANFVNESNNLGATSSGEWIRPPSAAGPFKNGFATPLSFLGARYAPPPPGSRILSGLDASGGAGTFTVNDAMHNAVLVKPVSVSIANAVTVAMPGADKLAVKLNKATGLLSGTFVQGGKPRVFQGIAIQGSAAFGGDRAAGFFLDSAGSYSVTLKP
jgi:Calx-beta domain